MRFSFITALLCLGSVANAAKCKNHASHHSNKPPIPTTTSAVMVSPESSPADLSSSSAQAAPTTALASTSIPETSVTSESSTTSETSVHPSSVVPTPSAVMFTSTTAVSMAASVVPVINAPQEADMCADNQQTLLDNWGLLVANSRVVESDVLGTVCTTYTDVVTLSDGQSAVQFTADANLAFEESTMNDNKYYSNVAVTKNVDNKLSDIVSIPASFTWSRTNTSDFRGNVCLDFVMAPTPHDWTSASTKEFQMWLHWQGDQQPLAWANGTKATFELWNQSWEMYQGVNYNLAGGEGVELTTILPHEDYGESGAWSGDVKDWLMEMVNQGIVTPDDYVNVGNAGTEQFYGDSILTGTVSLQINLN